MHKDARAEDKDHKRPKNKKHTRNRPPEETSGQIDLKLSRYGLQGLLRGFLEG
jgi:hypothetical protein